MKRTLLLLLILLPVIFVLSGCSKYTSHYMATLYVCSGDSDSASMDFGSFDGTQVFKLKCGKQDGAGIRYSGKLETGSLTVYYDCGGTKTELFPVHAGEAIESEMGTLTGDTVYIIVETSEKCENGSFTFEIFYG